jgi:hypothetical protein
VTWLAAIIILAVLVVGSLLGVVLFLIAGGGRPD